MNLYFVWTLSEIHIVQITLYCFCNVFVKEWRNKRDDMINSFLKLFIELGRQISTVSLWLTLRRRETNLKDLHNALYLTEDVQVTRT